MPDPVIGLAVGGAAVAGGYLQYRGAKEASKEQSRAAKKGIDEQRRQFEATQELLRPYVEAGGGSLEAQQALLGLAGPEAQAEAIRSLEMSPQFQSLVSQGETGILQNAAATGGLRGGNTQAALAQFRPEMLSRLIEQRYGQLGGITQMGQASAAGQASAGQAMGANIANLLAQQGAAQAGGTLGQAQAIGGTLQNLGNLALLSSFAGGGATPAASPMAGAQPRVF